MTSELPAQSLSGKVAIVTGSTRGLGAAIALDLAKRGAKVTITFTSSSSTKAADELVSTIQKLPNSSSAISIRADLSSSNSPAQIVSATTSAFGSFIDILVNNAALQITKSLREINVEDYNSVYNLNVRGVIFLTQAVLPHLRPSSRIINMSSVGARAGFPSLSLYTSSKAALEASTRSWAAELGHNGTTVNAVAPGPVATDMMSTIPPHILQKQKDMTPLQKRLGEPQEVADVVSWLAGPESAWVTGQTISVSGGWSML